MIGMKPTGNARSINVQAVNSVKRKFEPAAPNNSPSRNKTKTEKAASRPPRSQKS